MGDCSRGEQPLLGRRKATRLYTSLHFLPIDIIFLPIFRAEASFFNGITDYAFNKTGAAGEDNAPPTAPSRPVGATQEVRSNSLSPAQTWRHGPLANSAAIAFSLGSVSSFTMN
jgi:hypothetical protein